MNFTDSELREFLLTHVSSAIRNIEDPGYIAYRVNGICRLDGDERRTGVEQVQEVLDTLSWEELRRCLT